MKEAGIDIAHQRSKEVSEYAMEKFDYVVIALNSSAPYFRAPKQSIGDSTIQPKLPRTGNWRHFAASETRSASGSTYSYLRIVDNVTGSYVAKTPTFPGLFQSTTCALGLGRTAARTP